MWLGLELRLWLKLGKGWLDLAGVGVKMGLGKGVGLEKGMDGVWMGLNWEGMGLGFGWGWRKR